MKKEIIIGLTTILLVATPAIAAPGGNSGDAKQNHGQEVAGQKTENVPPVTLPTNVPVTVPPVGLIEEETPVLAADDVIVSPTLTPTPTKKLNNGQLKKVEGASTQQDVCDPAAAWKSHGAYVSCVAKTHPGGEAVSNAAKSDIGKKDHEATPSGIPSETPSPTPITSGEEELTLTSNPLETFIHALGRFFHNLPFFNKHS